MTLFVRASLGLRPDRWRLRAAGFLRVVLVLSALSPTARAADAEEPIFQDRFPGKLAAGWSWLREDPAAWRVGPAGLEVLVQPGNMWGRANNAKNVLVRPAPDPAGGPLEVAATLHNEPTGQWEQSNLVWFYDEGHMVKLGQELVSGKLSVVMGREEGDKTRTVGIVPLDAHTVELRLLVAGGRIHGQYRTVHWRAWREVGDCDLPSKGAPHVSLQFYQGPAEARHWAQARHVTVRRLAMAPARLEAQLLREQTWRAGQPAPAVLALPEGAPFFRLEHVIRAPATPGGKADAEQSVFSLRDGTYGWTWDRRALAADRPTVAGVVVADQAAGGLHFPQKLSAVESFHAEVDVVSRLDADRGQHSLCLQMQVSDSAAAGEGRLHRLSVWFDWQGKDAAGGDMFDGFRSYTREAGEPAVVDGVAQHVYRLVGLRGAPPRLNLKAFLADAAGRLQIDATALQLWQVGLANEAWNNSKGRTHVRRLDLILNGKRCSTVSTGGGLPAPRE